MKNRLMFKRMVHNPFFMVGFLVVALIVIMVFIVPFFCPYEPTKNSLTTIFLPPDGLSDGLQGHILGTDELGRDVFTRLLYGGRYSLFIAAVVVVLQIILGSVLGIMAGYFGGILDTIIMRLCDIVLFVLTFSGWVDCCKVTRNSVRVLKNQDFVKASTSLGASNWRIMFSQILPNVTTPIIILSSQRIGFTILLEAALSFLNLGIQPPIPSWGNMIASGRTFMTIYPWLVFAPGIALMLCVLGFNFLGDGLRDVLDPKRRR